MVLPSQIFLFCKKRFAAGVNLGKRELNVAGDLNRVSMWEKPKIFSLWLFLFTTFVTKTSLDLQSALFKEYPSTLKFCWCHPLGCLLIEILWIVLLSLWVCVKMNITGCWDWAWESRWWTFRCFTSTRALQNACNTECVIVGGSEVIKSCRISKCIWNFYAGTKMSLVILGIWFFLSLRGCLNPQLGEPATLHI